MSRRHWIGFAGVVVAVLVLTQNTRAQPGPNAGPLPDWVPADREADFRRFSELSKSGALAAREGLGQHALTELALRIASTELAKKEAKDISLGRVFGSMEAARDAIAEGKRIAERLAEKEKAGGDTVEPKGIGAQLLIEFGLQEKERTQLEVEFRKLIPPEVYALIEAERKARKTAVEELKTGLAQESAARQQLAADLSALRAALRDEIREEREAHKKALAKLEKEVARLEKDLADAQQQAVEDIEALTEELEALQEKLRAAEKRLAKLEKPMEPIYPLSEIIIESPQRRCQLSVRPVGVLGLRRSR